MKGRREKRAAQRQGVAQRVQLLRKAWGHTLREAGERCGLSAVTFLRLERGESGHRPTLNAVAAGYGVSFRWLVGEPDWAVELDLALRSMESREQLELYGLAPKRAAHALSLLLFQPEDRQAGERMAEETGVSAPRLKEIAFTGRMEPDTLHRAKSALARELPELWVRWGMLGTPERRAARLQEAVRRALDRRSLREHAGG